MGKPTGYDLEVGIERQRKKYSKLEKIDVMILLLHLVYLQYLLPIKELLRGKYNINVGHHSHHHRPTHRAHRSTDACVTVVLHIVTQASTSSFVFARMDCCFTGDIWSIDLSSR
jgi:hypothetical protein